MNHLNRELTQAVETLIDAGCHYRLNELAACYARDLEIIMVQENGEIMSFDYEQNMAFFQSLLDSGAPPLNTAVTFNYAQERNGVGYVIATRRINLGAGEKKVVFNLMLTQTADGWQVFREHALIVGDA